MAPFGLQKRLGRLAKLIELGTLTAYKEPVIENLFTSQNDRPDSGCSAGEKNIIGITRCGAVTNTILEIAENHLQEYSPSC